MPPQKKFLSLVYVSTFFYALHYALTLYIESSFLGQFFSERLIGLIYVVSAVLAITAIIYIPRFLSLNGNYRTSLFLITLEVITLFGLTLTSNPFMAIFLFTTHQVLLASLFVTINVFIESFSSDASTGRTRGIFLTIVNAAILTGPVVAGLFFKENGFSNVFLVAALLMIVMFLVIALNFKNYRDPAYNEFPFLQTLITVLRDGDVYRICAVRFLLEFFYTIMVVYTPIYLHKYMGIPFSDILGIIMPIALAPFVIFPYLIGIIVDKRLGEKELLIFGLSMIGITTISLSFITTDSIAVWAIFLLMTRVGASFIEETSDSYFFKHVNATNTNLIALFSNLRSLSIIVGPLLAILFLSVFEIRYIFIALGLVMLYGLRYALTLKDTK